MAKGSKTEAANIEKPEERKNLSGIEGQAKTTKDKDTRRSSGKDKISIKAGEKRDLSPGEIRDKQLRREMQIESIRSAIHNETLLKNTVIGIETVSVKGKSMVCLSFLLPEGIKAIIPYNKVFQSSPIREDTVNTATEKGRQELLTKQKQVLDAMLGAEIRWLPETIISDDDGKSVIVVGSRTAALAITRRTYYLRDNANCKVRNTYRGRFVFVRPHLALVSYGGVEKIIPQNALTNRYTEDLRDIFQPGDPISIFIRDLSVDKKTEEVKVLFDCLTGELIEKQENMKNIPIDGLTFATISRSIDYEDENGVKRTRLYAWIDGWDVPAKVTGVPYNRFGIPLKPGDTVRIKVTGVDDDGYAKCFIRSTHNTSGI